MLAEEEGERRGLFILLLSRNLGRERGERGNKGVGCLGFDGARWMARLGDKPNLLSDSVTRSSNSVLLRFHSVSLHKSTYRFFLI